MAIDLNERVRANHEAAAFYSVGLNDAVPSTVLTSCKGAGVTCSPADLAAYDLEQWRFELVKALPQGRAVVAPTSDRVVVTIYFNDSKVHDATVAGQVTNQSLRQLVF